MPVKLMSVEEWIKVEDNPIQRNTEAHARKAKHLRTPKKTHWIVFACQFPDKRLVKLDGHTRALLWKRKEIPEPPSGHLEAHIIPVADEAEAMELYRTFDTKDALETTNDKVSGAFHHLHFTPQSSLLQRGSITSAMKIAWNVWKGRGPRSPGQVKKGEMRLDFDIYEATWQFSPELFALDTFALDHQAVPSSIVAAFILTNRKHGLKVMPFWVGVFGDTGERTGGKMDGVQAVREMLLMRKGRHYQGQSSILDFTSRIVMACEKWLEHKLLEQVPRPFDINGYIANIKPHTRLIKPDRSGRQQRDERRVVM